MRLGEYFEVGKRMKQARTSAGINQRDMSAKLSLTNSSYSNYENGYSEPPVEIILKFCDILGITLNDLLEVKITSPKSTSVRTFADFLAILIDLDRRGIPIKGTTTYSQENNQLVGHLTLDIANAQIATFIPDWNKTNQQLADGLIDEEEYKIWLDDTLKLFNVPIEDYI
jgi:transcriptional regulator with XRE-family HTH domain